MTSVEAWYWATERVDAAKLAALEADLPDGERARAGRFVHAVDRRDYVAAHALLRRLLSLHGPLPPAAWTIAAADGAKPRLAVAQAGTPPLRFSLSHARGVVACAVARGTEVGIDVEGVDRPRIGEGARDLLAASELHDLDALPPEARAARFAELWTLREAWVKGRGDGLWTASPEAVRFAFGGATGLERQGDAAASWEFASVPIGPAHRLAVAMEVPAGDRRWSLALHHVDGGAAGGPVRWTGDGRMVPLRPADGGPTPSPGGRGS